MTLPLFAASSGAEGATAPLGPEVSPGIVDARAEASGGGWSRWTSTATSPLPTRVCSSSAGIASQHLVHARYYSPVVGRFLSIDPGRDWNAREPQSWNLFSYARNNPLRYVDPDGRLNYEALLFGQKVPVRVDDRLSKKQQLALKKKLDAALHKLNSGKALTKEEVATIRNVKSIAVDGSARRSSILESTGAFTLIPGDVRDSSASFLGSSLAHDAKHVELFQQGGLRLSRGLGAEVDAMKFQLQVGEKIGISSEEAGYLRDLIRDPKRLEQYIWTSP